MKKKNRLVKMLFSSQRENKEAFRIKKKSLNDNIYK